MTLAEQAAEKEAELRELKAKCEHLQSTKDMQKGALEESRAQNRQLIKRNEQLSAQLARFEKHFRDAVGSAESIVKHRDELKVAENVAFHPPIDTPAGKVLHQSLTERIATRLKRNGGEAA